MAMLDWRVTVAQEDGPTAVTGMIDTPAAGEVRVVCELPKGTLQGASATMSISMEADEHVFMNGYQSWTSCPERGKKDRIRGLGGLSGLFIEKQGLDRYGDYHFVPYPQKAGVTHGFSWCWFRKGGRYRLIASLDEHPGYTMFQYDSAKGELTIDRDCEGLRCEGEFHVFDLYFAEGTEDEVFDGWFAAMGIAKPGTPPLRGYCSWYNHFQAIDIDTLRADFESFQKVMSPGDVFLIDDGWESAVGDWLSPDRAKFPEGLSGFVKEIHAAGFRAGLWLAPFVVQRGAALIELHPDWLLRRDDESWRCGGNWSGAYSLDIDNPEVTDYLRRVFRRVTDEWDFDLVKLDFLYGAAPFGTEAESRAARMIRAMDFLRDACGKKQIIGCGVPLMPAFGRVDYCRIGPDVGLDWDGSRLDRLTHRERVSTKNAILNTLFRRQLDGRAFRNDPDVFFLREENLKLTQEQKWLLGQVAALLGGALLTSDDPSVWRPPQREQYRELLALQEAENVQVDADAMLIRYTLGGQKHLLTLPKEWFK